MAKNVDQHEKRKGIVYTFTQSISLLKNCVLVLMFKIDSNVLPHILKNKYFQKVISNQSRKL